MAAVIDTKKYYDNGMCEIRQSLEGRGKVARARDMQRAAVSLDVVSVCVRSYPSEVVADSGCYQ